MIVAFWPDASPDNTQRKRKAVRTAVSSFPIAKFTDCVATAIDPPGSVLLLRYDASDS